MDLKKLKKTELFKIDKSYFDLHKKPFKATVV